jgi:hypothetical protein
VNYDRDDYIDWLTEQIVATSEVLGHDIKATAAGMMAEDLCDYPPAVMKKAMRRVRAEHTGRLTLKAILDRVDEAVGRPAANEAWAAALEALDEAKTVVWTDEMAQAWGVARPIAAAGDLVGARMAFIGAYERLVRDAREAGAMPVVTVSEGWDKDQRVAAVEKAARLGYLPQEQARAYLPAPEQPVFNPVALLGGRVEVSAGAPPEVRERLRKLCVEMEQSDKVRAEQRRQQREREAFDLQRRKADVARMVADYTRKAA